MRFDPSTKSPGVLKRIEKAKDELATAQLKLDILRYMTEDKPHD